MAVNHQIASLIAAGYDRLAVIALDIVENFDDGYGQSEKQNELRKRLIKGTKILESISRFVEFNDDGDYVAVHRLSDTQINDLLKDLVKVLKIKGLPVAPKIFYRGYPYIRTEGGPGPQGDPGEQGPPGGGVDFSSLNFSSAANIVDRFPITDSRSARWEYELYGALGRRMGTIRAIWNDDGLTISEPSEVGSDDIGATIGNITFTVEKDGTDIVLKANRVSGTWNIRGLRYFPGNNATLPTSGLLPNGQIYVGDSGNAAVARTPGGVLSMTNTGVFSFVAGSIVNADINAAAAIAYSKLNLSASVVNADIASGAAIAYSKLNLSASIVNADIASAAAIARTKIASGTAYRVVVNDSLGALSEVTLTASRALVSDANGLPTVSATTATQVGYSSDVTSPIQAQLNAKQATIATTTNSFIKYNGSAVVATNVYSNVNGSITLGDSGLSGDRTISAVSSDTNSSITLSAQGSGGLINLTPAIRVLRLDGASTNTIATAATLTYGTSGTPASGIGVGINLEVETSASNFEILGAVQVQMTSGTLGAERSEMLLRTFYNGSVFTSMTISPLSGITLNNQSGASVTITGNTLQWNVGASGSTTADFLAGAGNSGAVNGQGATISAGDAYSSSGNGNGGGVLIRSGERRTAGSGTDGDITLNPRTGHVLITFLPTSSAGLPSGAIWNDSGTLKIV